MRAHMQRVIKENSARAYLCSLPVPQPHFAVRITRRDIPMQKEQCEYNFSREKKSLENSQVRRIKQKIK